MDKEKKYIYENIEKLNFHNNYISIIDFHKCPHTKNSNGVFVNLNKINDKVLKELYYKLKNEIENESFNQFNIKKESIKEEIITLFNNKTEKKINYENILDTQFSNEEKLLIQLSKKYIL
ncbi:MAG: hypothetical protein CL779_03075 [Chloroflexi bacterium]|nr:hypothetical protein [Chloroflexota bacterium]|tara:strand:+ start:226 stop:585 length:360 start_codon:yes stop_codon:yes gene_type:complete